ncbi:MAG TPA: hypothetical protein VLT36_24760 [Candidatus Dormibacteraeota bacterium]|nr:hypothetical protein [Candidatus Dormibacteraeota bacterium]
MADQVAAGAPPKKRRFLRVLAWIISVFILLIVVVYFVATSSAFLKGVILPKVSKAANADITISDASISPFKEVVLHNLKVQPTGQETLLTATEVHARYSLMDIIGGNIHVEEAVITSPVITLVENPDRSSNLDPLTKGQKEKPEGNKPEAKQQKEGKPSKPPQIDIKKLALTDATVKRTKLYKGGSRDVAEISHLNVTIQDLKNGQTGKISLGADLNVESNPPGGTNGVLQGKVDGNFSLALSQDLKPSAVQGNTKLEVTRAAGAFADVAALAANIDCDVTPTEIKQVALRFTKSGSTLGQLLVSGPFDAEKMEGKITVQLVSIDKQVLNLAGAKNGLDFGPTVVSSTNQIELAKAGSSITASGQLNLNKLQVTRQGQTTPTLDLLAKYDVSLDRTASNAVLRQLDLTGTQKGNPLLKADLASPMTLSWGAAAANVGDSTLNLVLTNLNLNDWKPFIGEAVSSGEVSTKMQLLSQQAGKLLTFNVDSRIANLSATAASNQITQATVTFHANGKATDLKKFNLTACELALAHQDKPVLSVTAAGTFDEPTSAADMQVNLQAGLPQLLELAPQTNMTLSSGKIVVQTHILQRSEGGSSSNTIQTVTGNFALSDLSGKMGATDLKSLGTTMDLDLSKAGNSLQIKRVTGKLQSEGKPGGSFDVSGSCDLSNKAAQITAKFIDINQNAIGPFLASALDDKKLNSISLNATTTTQYNPEGDTSVKADFSVTNLVVTDPKGQIPGSPLEAKMQVDVSSRKQATDIRTFAITLTPTQRAKNEIRISGHLDQSNTNAMQGNLKIAADSIDVTSYYDLFAGQKKEPETKGEKPAPSQPTTAQTTPAKSNEPQKEPGPTTLPFKNFTADVNIGRFYLRELEITNWVTTAKVDGGHLVLNPFQLALNGAPVKANADIDLGVPGYKYDTSFGMQAVPFAPLVNSFAPERKGQMGGTLTVDAKVAGAGITGPNIQKNLNGKVDVVTTNLNLSVVNIKSPIFRELIDVVGTLPELVRDPASGVGSLLSGVIGSNNGGLAEELKRSPINAVILHATAGTGRVDLQQAVVQSAAFEADAKGGITLASVLTNSTIDLPVTIAVSRPIADKMSLSSANTPTNAAYVPLPAFFSMKGTVGNPKKDINKLALFGIAAKGLTGSVPASGTVGNVLNSVNSLFGGGSKTNTSPGAATNSPPPSNPVNNLLNNFLKPKK